MDIISLAIAAKAGGGGGGSSETFIGNIDESTTHFPSARPDGSSLQSGDYVKVDSRATLPFTIDGIEFSTYKDKGAFIGGTWVLNASPSQNTDEMLLSDSTVESISGTAATQNEANIEFVESIKNVKTNAYKDIRFIKDYLYEVNYDILDYDYALDYFDTHREDGSFGACSSMRKGNKLGRNFDWIYDENAEFIVKTDATQGRKAVLGVASTLNLKNDFVKSRAYSDLYKIVPFCLVDGINEDGLAISVNVVPKEKGDNSLVKSLNSTETICSKMLSRYVLDKFSTVNEAVEYLKTNVDIYPSRGLTEMGYETHYLLADSNNTVVIEFVEGRIVAIDVAYGEGFENRQYMTNFHLAGTVLNEDGTVYTPETDGEHNPEDVNHITPHGCGLERYNLIANAWATDDIEEILSALTYTNAYKDSTTPYWYTEFVDGNIKVSSSVSDFTSAVAASQYAYQHRTREEDEQYYGTWQTTHSSVYDLNNRTLTIKTQEEDQTFNFNLNSSVQIPSIDNLDANKEYVLKVVNKSLQWIEINGDLLVALNSNVN